MINKAKKRKCLVTLPTLLFWGLFTQTFLKNFGILKIVSIIRKYHNHKPQTTPWHQEEEPPNHNQTPGRQIKCLNAFYWYQIFALDSAVVEVQEMFSSHGGHLTNAMYHHGETLIKLTHHDETKKRAHDSQIARAKENLKLSHSVFRLFLSFFSVFFPFKKSLINKSLPTY